MLLTALASHGAAAAVQTGPDLTVQSIPAAASWGTADGRNAYSLGVSACNIGDDRVSWDAASAAHPVVVQNLHRLHQGRFEQIGMSWATHEFCALQIQCDSCQPAPTCSELGVGCMDASSVMIMGQLFGFGPRSEVNPSTGVFPVPYTLPGPPEAPVLRGRIVVDNTDLDPALNAGAQYFAELQYVAADDALAGNAWNNASWRPVAVSAAGGDLYSISVTGTTHVGEPAISAWQAIDPEVVLLPIDVPGDGRFIIGARATARPGGVYAYDYAILNMSSHRAAGAFEVEHAAGAAISAIAFHDVAYHSGEVYDGTDWAISDDGAAIIWATETFETNPLANALRWGTLYSFHFLAERAPRPTTARLHLFRPPAGGGETFITLSIPGPGGCPGDVDGDGMVDVVDLLAVIGFWGPCADCPEDLDGDGMVDVQDLLAVIGHWGPCVP